MKCNQNKIFFNSWRWGCFPPDGVRGRCYVHMLNAACLSPFSVPCHRYHLTQELFRGQLFQAIESRSKPALCFCDSVFSSPFLHNQSLTASGTERGGESSPQLCIISHKYDQLSLAAESSTERDTECVFRSFFFFFFVTHSCKMLHFEHVVRCTNFLGKKDKKDSLPRGST